MSRRARAAATALVAVLSAVSIAQPPQSPQGHAATGLVTAVDAAHHRVVISCREIPGYMAAMEMEFRVDSPADLRAARQGSVVAFTMVEAPGVVRAAGIHAAATANLESEPLQAGQLAMLGRALAPDRTVAVGQPVPDFALLDQSGKEIRLSGLRGKAVLLTFGYSRCPNPNYCLRLSNNLGKVEQRFHARAGRDFVLLTIGIDPEHDHGATLARYAASFHADPAVWHFLTGSTEDIHHIAGLFGMDFQNEEGLVTHTLHTAVLDSRGTLVANLNGNAFSAQQLGDLLATVMPAN